MSKSDKKEVRLKIEKTISQALKSIALVETKKSQKLVKKFSKDIASIVVSQLKKKEKDQDGSKDKEIVKLKKKTPVKKSASKQTGSEASNKKGLN